MQQQRDSREVVQRGHQVVVPTQAGGRDTIPPGWSDLPPSARFLLLENH